MFQLLVDEVLIERRPSDAQLLRGESDITIARFERVHNRAPLHVLQRGQIQSCRLARCREQLLPLAIALAVQVVRQVATRVVDRVREVALECEARGGMDLGFSRPELPLLLSLRVRTRCGSCQFEFGVVVGVGVALSLFPLVEFLQLILLSSFQFGSIG